MADLLESLRERSAEEPFRGFRCWVDSEVGEIMHREAAAPSDAVLLATHQPPRIRRVTVTDAGRYGSDDLVTQNEVLEAVTSDSDQSLVVPIIGASGSGKSHLVLWMRARLAEESSPNRKIIYLPKGDTSLSRVIDLILDGRTGGRFDEIRQAVSKATRAMTLDEAARRLRDELAVASAGIDPAGGGPQLEPLRRHVKDNIGNLLDDPAYVTRLVGEGGPLRRIVEQALSGASEEPAELKLEDVDTQLTSVELEELSRPAKTFLSDLQTPALHEAAIDVLNEVRDRCLSRIFGVEPMQLVGVMRELRERIYEENPALELVLMVEDFTLLQGIQHDLLEAMIELPRRGGRQVMCSMKTVMAVTDGFFNGMLVSSDTLRTRIAAQGHVYNLDVQYQADSTGALDRDSVVEFTGRYLNAVRVGAGILDDRAPTVTNACDYCAHRDECHDGFGTSGADGYGLYPYNEHAIDRMVRSRQDKFNPRDLLTAMAQTLSTHGQEIADGRFPSLAWERAFDPRQHDRPALPTLPLRTQQQIDTLPKSEQRTILLTFWGGARDELCNLAPGIHEAFDIPLAPDAEISVPIRDPVRPSPDKPAPVVDDIGDGVRQWRDGGRLDAEFARILRRVFRDAITQALDPEGELFSPQLLSEFFDRDADVEIDNAPGGGRRVAGRFRVQFDASNDHALLFEGVLRAEREKSWAFADGHPALVAFLSRVDVEADRLRSAVAERLADRGSSEASTIALLAISGLVVGQGSPSDARGLLTAALSGQTSASEHMPARWRVLASQCEKRRAVAREYALQAAHVSKSTAEPAGADGSKFLPALRALTSDWQLPDVSESVPVPVQTLRQELAVRLEPALDEAFETLREWHTDVTRLVGDPETLGDRLRSWRAALDEARDKGGFLVTAGGYTADGALSQLAPTVRFVEGVVSQWAELDLGRRIAAVSRAPWARLVPLRDHLSALEATFVASIKKAETQDGKAGSGSPVDEFERALDRLAAAAASGRGQGGA